MFCGTGSFKRLDDDPEVGGTGGGGGSPKQPRRKHGGGRKGNPYAERGLEKFSTVLSELETRRNRILRCVGSESGLVMVRFVQSNGAWEPIIVKLPEEHRTNAAAAKKPKPSTAAIEPARPAASSTTQPDPASPKEAAAKNALARASKAPARRASSFSWGRLRRPARYRPAVMVLILMLVCLAVFGRVFAICCTSIWWYLVPNLMSNGCPIGTGEDASQAGLRRSMEKRRKVSPPVSSCGLHESGSSPRSRAKGKKG